MDEQTPEETSTDISPAYSQPTVQPKPMNHKFVPALLGAIALLLIVIVGLLVVILGKSATTAADINPTPAVQTPAPTAVVYTEVPKPTTSISPSITPTTVPEITWKSYSYKVTGIYSEWDKTVSGNFPNDTVINTQNLDAAGVEFKDKNYALYVYFVPDGDVVHYVSYKSLPAQDQFGQIYRVRMDDTSNTAYYVSGPITTTGGCSYLFENISSPCGSDLIQGDGYIMSVRCSAALTYRDSICDSIVNSLKVL